MSYIILNGIKSTLIKGLMIQSLPPITKPLMRAEVEEIDGRDGDITRRLGYAAYDKQIVIGLHGGFDIDQVIKYFDSEGEVTFSNEPDKYYRYKILEQIDFERLIRYRVAKVKMHVQPFKYPLAEHPQDYSQDDSVIEAVIFNSGNIIARPKLTIYGSDDISVYLGANQVFQIALGDDGYITIDAEALEAYKDGTLKNRLVTGDYNNMVLQPGANTLRLTGGISDLTVENYSRWI